MLYPTWLGKWDRSFLLVNAKLRFRYPVVDGTYLVTDQLQLNGSSPIANVHVMMGVMRDDGLAFI